MGEFYNKGRTPTSATTRSGGTVCFSPRVWQHVPLAEESSSSIQALVRKGFLTRRDSRSDHVVSEPGVEVQVVVVVDAPVIAPLPTGHAEVEEKVEEIASPNFEVPTETEIVKEVEADVAIEDSSGTESLSRSRSSRRR